MNILYVFPGQGSQYEGMGKDLCAAHDVAARLYEQANDVLGYDIRDMSFNNPGDELNLTRNTARRPAAACSRRWRPATAWASTRRSSPRAR